MATKQKETKIVIEPVKTEQIEIALLGISPLILNRMSEKVKTTLLLPRDHPMTKAEKAVNLKHNPLEEYRTSAYILPGGNTLLGIMASAVKGAMMTAALDLPGATKTQIGRLVYVIGDYIPVYGVPKLFMSVTRSADMSRTPDVRTRAIVPEWAAVVSIRFVAPLLNATNIINLLSAGGITAGVGDWRPEKGKGSYGQFSVVNLDDPELNRIVTVGGREAQQAAIATPDFYDDDSTRLFAWYNEEVARRGKS